MPPIRSYTELCSLLSLLVSEACSCGFQKSEALLIPMLPLEQMPEQAPVPGQDQRGHQRDLHAWLTQLRQSC